MTPKKPQTDTPELEPVDIRAKLARMEQDTAKVAQEVAQAEMDEVSKYVDAYLLKMGYELVPILIFMGDKQQGQVAYRKKK